MEQARTHRIDEVKQVRVIDFMPAGMKSITYTYEVESVVAGDDQPQEESMQDVDETLDSYDDNSQNKMDHENVNPSMVSDIEAEFSLTDCEDEVS